MQRKHNIYISTLTILPFQTQPPKLPESTPPTQYDIIFNGIQQEIDHLFDNAVFHTDALNRRNITTNFTIPIARYDTETMIELNEDKVREWLKLVTLSVMELFYAEQYDIVGIKERINSFLMSCIKTQDQSITALFDVLDMLNMPNNQTNINKALTYIRNLKLLKFTYRPSSNDQTADLNYVEFMQFLKTTSSNLTYNSANIVIYQFLINTNTLLNAYTRTGGNVISKKLGRKQIANKVFE